MKVNKVDRYDKSNLSEEEFEQYKKDLNSIEYIVSRMHKVQGLSTDVEIAPVELTLDTYVELREAHFSESEALKLTEFITNSYYKGLRHKLIKDFIGDSDLREIVDTFVNSERND